MAKIKKESKRKGNIKKLKTLCKKLNEDSRAAISDLMDRIEFLSEQLDILQEHIKIHGVKEEYKNGANQYGFKESVESTIYTKNLKLYLSSVKQLIDILYRERVLTLDDDDDELSEYY